MKTKILAIMAVLMLAFAGVGVIATDESDAEVTGSVNIVLEGYYLSDAGVIAVLTDEAQAEVTYLATFNEGFEDSMTVITKDYYDAMKLSDKVTFKGETVIFTAAALASDDVVAGLSAFTSAEFNKLGEIKGGVSTKIAFPSEVLTKNVTYSLVDAEGMEEAVAAAVAVAVIGLFTQEDLDKAIADAKAGLFTQEDLDKAIADAKKTAVDTNLWMYAFVVVVIVLIALAAFMLFKMLKDKPKKAKESTE